MKNIIGAQLYTVRDYCQTKEDFDEKYLTQFRNNALRAVKCDEVQLYMMPASPMTGHAKEEGSPIPERL